MRVYANLSNTLVEFGVGTAGGSVVVTAVPVFLGLYGWMIRETVCKKGYALMEWSSREETLHTCNLSSGLFAPP